MTCALTAPRAVADRMAAARRDLVELLSRQSEADRLETMFSACIETGGNYIPQATAPNNAAFAEIDCLGVYHSGDDMPEAIAGWIKAVQRSIAIEDRGQAA